MLSFFIYMYVLIFSFAFKGFTCSFYNGIGDILLLTGSGNGTTCGADTLDGIKTGDQLVYGMSYDEKTGAWYFSVVNKVSIYL